jgi:hypothetical protein
MPAPSVAAGASLRAAILEGGAIIRLRKFRHVARLEHRPGQRGPGKQ